MLNEVKHPSGEGVSHPAQIPPPRGRGWNDALQDLSCHFERLVPSEAEGSEKSGLCGRARFFAATGLTF